MSDPFDLQRFLEAQAPVYESVVEELRAGKKRGHWMWFIFPQVRGLGASATSVYYAISGREEAVAYARHAVLGPRLDECTRLVNGVRGRSIEGIFGDPDTLKFRSCMTLFAETAEENQVYREALRLHFRGEPDASTLRILGAD